MSTDSPLQVVEIGPDRATDWDGYIASSPEASVYHRAVWRDLITEVFGRETHYLAASAGGRICGVLPLVRLKSRIFGDFLVSLPYVSYGGVIADTEPARQSLLAAGIDVAKRLGVQHLELRHVSDFAELPRRTDKVSMVLDLCGSSEERWKKLGSKRRSQIKRPLREGASCETGGSELLEDFYRVFALKYRDLGVPVYPVKWFSAILRAFADEARVFVVRIGNQPVAASIVIADGEHLEVPWASSLRSADRFGVNMFLYWNMIEFAEDNGFRVFDFGRSTVDSGTWRFKKQWGAREVQLYWHYWLRDEEDIPKLNTDNPKFRLAVNAWRRLPLWMTKMLGPRIVRNLP